MDYDLAVIGAGWAGFNAAIKAKESGLKTLIIEKEHLGGTCLNRGCIPTKALIQSAKVFSLAKKSLSFGVTISNPEVDFNKIQERKNKIITQLQGNMQFSLKGIDFLKEEARFLSADQIKAGGKNISAKNILIACGSKPMELKNLKFDGKKIISSDDILNLKEAPKSLLIIGGGVIGCEFAALFSALGTQVSIAELTAHLLPGIDKEVARKLENIFKKKGIKANTSTDASTLDLNNYETALLCAGRAANTESLGTEKAGIFLEKNRIVVDEYLRTNVANIYAAGDCAGKIMLAHYAAYQGEIAASNIVNPQSLKKADNQIVPSCIFTDPEIACVGLSEEEAKARGLEIQIKKFDFLGSGMARIMEETEGFIKMISDAKTKELLGASIIGPKATELIGILGLAVTLHLNSAQIQEVIFAHPTLSESIKEAVR